MQIKKLINKCKNHRENGGKKDNTTVKNFCNFVIILVNVDCYIFHHSGLNTGFFYPHSRHLVASIQERMTLSPLFTQLRLPFFVLVSRHLTECSFQPVCLYPPWGTIPQFCLYPWLQYQHTYYCDCCQVLLYVFHSS